MNFAQNLLLFLLHTLLVSRINSTQTQSTLQRLPAVFGLEACQHFQIRALDQRTREDWNKRGCESSVWHVNQRSSRAEQLARRAGGSSSAGGIRCFRSFVREFFLQEGGVEWLSGSLRTGSGGTSHFLSADRPSRRPRAQPPHPPTVPAEGAEDRHIPRQRIERRGGQKQREEEAAASVRSGRWEQRGF